MADLALSTVTDVSAAFPTEAGDLLIDPDTGDLVILTGAEAIAQHIRIRLQFFLGECQWDTRGGIPYYQAVLLKNPNLPVVRAIFREAIMETPGVIELLALDLDLQSATRTLRVYAKIRVDGDAILTFDEPLLIDVLGTLGG